MSVDDFALVLEKIRPFKGNFHLHGYGEPLLDRLLPKKIQLLKTQFPDAKTMIYSTLSVNSNPVYFEELARSGLDHMVVSLYGFTRESYQKIHGFDGFDRVLRNLELLSTLIKNSKAPLIIHVKIPQPTIYSTLPVAEPEGKTAFIQKANTWGCNIVEWLAVHNFGDGRTYNAPVNDRPCPVIDGIRKNILNITWDLNVIPCCYDFNASIPFGNLRTHTLEEIFSSQEYYHFVLAHTTGQLSSYPVCQNCEKYDYE
jgi:MoaA/NifB/PqqE/SkfB family radical SAM enzyme